MSSAGTRHARAPAMQALCCGMASPSSCTTACRLASAAPHHGSHAFAPLVARVPSPEVTTAMLPRGQYRHFCTPLPSCSAAGGERGQGGW